MSVLIPENNNSFSQFLKSGFFSVTTNLYAKYAI